MGEGLTYESLNLASVWRVPMLFVVEHNGIAQTTRTADTIGGSILARGAAFGLRTWRCDDADPAVLRATSRIVVRTVRATREPGFLVIDTMRLGPHSKGDDLRDEAEMAAIRARDPLAGVGRTARLRDPDGHRTAQRRVHPRRPRRRDGCAGISVRCGADAHVLAARVRRVRRRRGTDSYRRDDVNVRSSLNDALRRMLAKDERVILLGEDLHDPYGGAFKVTAGLSTEFAGRVISTPISEAGLVGASIGLALAGYRPVAEIMFADFITLAMDQIYNHAVKFPAMFDGMRIPLVVRTPSGGRRGYGPTHSQSPENLMTAVPGLTVVFPSHRHDVGRLLEHAHARVGSPGRLLRAQAALWRDTGPGATTKCSVARLHDPGSALFPTLVRRQDRSGSDAGGIWRDARDRRAGRAMRSWRKI